MSHPPSPIPTPSCRPEEFPLPWEPALTQLRELEEPQLDTLVTRWLTAIGRFTYGTQDYQGSTRSDQIYSISGDLVYKLTREFQIKAQVRRDILSSNISGASSASTVVMLGVRLQR